MQAPQSGGPPASSAVDQQQQQPQAVRAHMQQAGASEQARRVAPPQQAPGPRPPVLQHCSALAKRLTWLSVHRRQVHFPALQTEALREPVFTLLTFFADRLLEYSLTYLSKCKDSQENFSIQDVAQFCVDHLGYPVDALEIPYPNLKPKQPRQLRKAVTHLPTNPKSDENCSVINKTTKSNPLASCI